MVLRSCLRNVIDKASFCSWSPSVLLRRCSRERAFGLGKLVHDDIILNGQDDSTFLGNLLLQMYSDCGAYDDAKALFPQIKKRNQYTWRIMILSSVYEGRIDLAVRLFEEMIRTWIIPDRLTFITVISHCATGNWIYLDLGRKIHYLTLVWDLNLDLIIGNALITMYGKNGSIEDARITFEHMPLRDVVTWNAMIAAFASEGQAYEAIWLFQKMEKEHFVPDRITFISILSVLDSWSVLDDAMYIHNLILMGKFQDDTAICNALIKMYCECECLEGAERTFDTMIERDIISWTTILAGYAKHGHFRKVFQLFQQLQQECMIPNDVTHVTCLNACSNKETLSAGKQMHACIVSCRKNGQTVLNTALVNMYGKAGYVAMAESVFDNMSQRNIVSWGTIVAMHVDSTNIKAATQRFDQMQQEGEIVDKCILISILDGCSCRAGLKKGQQVHVEALGNSNCMDVQVNSALIKMYAKSNNLEAAEDIFISISDRNIFAWNAIVVGYIEIEAGKTALQYINRMQQESIMPDKVSFVNVLSACGIEMDLLTASKWHAAFWHSKFKVDVFLWNALVSMYGRCGNVIDAEKVFQKMSEKNITSWNALIAAFAQNGHSNKSLLTFDQMKHECVEEPNEATFSIILFACSHGGLINFAFYYLSLMIQTHGITPLVDHYNCMIDLLSRAGQSMEADFLLQNMPCEPNTISLLTLLGTCRHQNDIDLGECVAMRVFQLEPANPTPFVMLSNIYAKDDM